MCGGALCRGCTRDAENAANPRAAVEKANKLLQMMATPRHTDDSVLAVAAADQLARAWGVKKPAREIK